MAASLGDEVKVMGFDNFQELLGGDSFCHRFGSGDCKLSHLDASDLGRFFGSILQVEFDGFLEIRESLLLGAAKGGDVVIEALDDVIRILAVEGVVDRSHRLNLRGGSGGWQGCGFN